MLSQSLIDTYAALAGPTLSWEGANGVAPRGLGNRPSSAYRKGLRRFLADAASSRCAACGHVLDETTQLCHVVARGPHHRGWQPGNIYAGHARCNYQDRTIGDVLPLTRFAFPNLVATQWPKRLKAYAA